jgi:hypothetical protein
MMKITPGNIIGAVVGIAIQAAIIWGAFWVLTRAGLVDQQLAFKTAAIVSAVIMGATSLTDAAKKYMMNASRDRVVEAASQEVSNADSSSNASSIASGAVTSGVVMA